MKDLPLSAVVFQVFTGRVEILCELELVPPTENRLAVVKRSRAWFPTKPEGPDAMGYGRWHMTMLVANIMFNIGQNRNFSLI